MCRGSQLLARLIAIRVWVQVPMLCGFYDLYGFLFRHALCMLLWNAYWGLSGSFPLAVTCILLSVLLPAAFVTDNLNTSIPDSLLTSIVFSFQKCLAAIPFTWGKKASWLTQTEQKLSFLLCITFVWEKLGGKKAWRDLGFTGLVLLLGRLQHLSFSSQSWVSAELVFCSFF